MSGSVRSGRGTPGSTRPQSPSDFSMSRSAANARLAATPVPAEPTSRSSDDGISSRPSVSIPGKTDQYPTASRESALASALSASLGQGLPVSADDQRISKPSALDGSEGPYEDFDVVRRHLAGPISGSPAYSSSHGIADARDGTANRAQKSKAVEVADAPAVDENEFSSLRLQGGDITREIYRRTEAEKHKLQRSHSMGVPRLDDNSQTMTAEAMRQPGGFRREHLRRHSPWPNRDRSLSGNGIPLAPQRSILTRNFFEFLSLYGHFAGEDVEDGEDDSHYASSSVSADRPDEGQAGDEGDPDEESPLLKRQGARAKRRETRGPKSGTAGTVFILLKSFVGTGVLFLPRAFLNGGMLFSFLVLLLVSAVSYYCFLLLTTSRLKLRGSFADMGEMIYGKWMRTLINTSLVISQMGFASAYIVFTSENLRAFILAVSKCATNIDIKLIILMQLIIFMPLSLYRNLNNISIIVYIADVFIVLGLIYLYYYSVSTLVVQRGIADIELFNGRGWTVFIGTAIFTFEGIGLIVPIQDGMKKPQHLPVILGGVMVIISVIFISMGSIAYAAFGSKTETVILLNMDQENKFVNGVQFLYSLAIVLSTPMQIFPAITIMENGIFTRSGKYNKGIKWQKNIFRFTVIMVSALIAWVGANDLDRFVALVGSFACVPLVYIYPPLIHFRAVARARWAQLVDLALCAIGLVLMVYTSAITMMTWVTGDSQKSSSPGYCDRP